MCVVYITLIQKLPVSLYTRYSERVYVYDAAARKLLKKFSKASQSSPLSVEDFTQLCSNVSLWPELHKLLMHPQELR